MPVVSVSGPFAHDVIIERALLERVGDSALKAGVPRGARVLLAEDANVADPHGNRAVAALERSGFAVTRAQVIADEQKKTTPAVEALWSAALAARLGRGDAFVALGGGLVGDVVGFAAATYLRGVAVVQVPTTLLAMVDASTGGKTGVNVALPGTAQELGKNLAGAFWPPKVVLADPETLRTLPPRELRSGLAECIKHALIEGEEHLRFVEESLERVLALDMDALVALIARSVAVKAAIVSRDPREGGERAKLNLGHTFGHALETLPALKLSHGEAVALGLIAACALNEANRELQARVTKLIERAGLLTRVSASIEVAGVLRRIGFDKKAERGSARFVVPDAAGKVRFGVEVPEGAVRAALSAIGVR